MADLTEIVTSMIAHQLAIIDLLITKDIFTLEEFQQCIPRMTAILDQESAKVRDKQIEELAHKCNIDTSKIRRLMDLFSELVDKRDENKKV